MTRANTNNDLENRLPTHTNIRPRYHSFAGKGSSEFALTHVLQPMAYAYDPLCLCVSLLSEFASVHSIMWGLRISVYGCCKATSLYSRASYVWNAYTCVLPARSSRLSEMAVPVSFIYGDRDWCACLLALLPKIDPQLLIRSRTRPRPIPSCL